MKSHLISQVLQVLGVLPLLVYPAVLVANAMQASALMDASQRKTGSFGQRLLMGTFVGGTTVYPLVLLVCRALAGRAQSQVNEPRELAWSATPLFFIGALAALFVGMERAENSA